MNVLRPGMQVHAVPDSEKAYDASGRRLPWAYEQSDIDGSRRRELEEKGPFGRSVRKRVFSRSKTATPARKEDAVRLENVHAEDAIFSSYKAAQTSRENNSPAKQAANGAAATDSGAAESRTPAVSSEPTEVILYGYGPDQEWAAISFYEKVSNGGILEDYERRPPHQRFDLSLALPRSPSAASILSPAAKAKRNRYFGGNHIIKVTFDSQPAADLACHRSPHPINGYLVFAEPFRATSPPKDAPIPYSNAGAQIDSMSLPRSFSTATLSRTQTGNGSESSSSQTLSTATLDGTGADDRPARYGSRATTQGPQRSTTVPNFSSADIFQPFSRRLGNSDSEAPEGNSDSAVPAGTASGAAVGGAGSTLSQRAPQSQRSMRLTGAKRAVLLPADQAFLPPKQTYTGWLAFLPFLMALFVGTSSSSAIQSQSQQQQQQQQQQQLGRLQGTSQSSSQTMSMSTNQQKPAQALAIGNQIPRLDDGSFDWKNASLYWRCMAWLDSVFGTDMCGLQQD